MSEPSLPNSSSGARQRPAPPPPCVTCNHFVDVKTARKIPEYGDYGALLNVEFECARCVAASSTSRSCDETAPAYERVSHTDLAVGDQVEWDLIASNEGWEWCRCTVIGTDPFTVRFSDGREKSLREGADAPRLQRATSRERHS